jgi:hypothetical protein
MDNKDKRENTRYHSLNLVSFIHYDSEGEKKLEGVGRIWDLSKGGFRLQVPESMEKGTRIELTIAIKEKVINFEGIIVYVKEVPEDDFYDIGVKLTSELGEDYEFLKDYLAKLKANINS